MALVIPEGRVKESATVSGTNSYAIVGPVGDTFLGFSSEVGNGNSVDFCAVDEGLTEFEIARGTVTTGTPTTLSRDTIYKSTNGDAAVDWPANSAVFVFAIIRGGIVKHGAYALDGEAMTITASGQSSIAESSTVTEETRVTVGQKLAQRWHLVGGVPHLQLYWLDSSSALGPVLTLRRDSASPAANDLLAEIRYDGQNSANAQVTYARIRSTLLDPASGNEDGRLDFAVRRDGALQDAMQVTTGSTGETYVQIRWEDNGATAGPVLALWKDSQSPAANDVLGSIHFRGENSTSEQLAYARIQAISDVVTDGIEDGTLQLIVMTNGVSTEVGRINRFQFLVGKSVAGIENVGFHAGTAGRVDITRDNATPLAINRLNGDGVLIQFYKDSSTVGDISVSGDTVSLTGFTGAHAAQWATGHVPEDEPPIGTLLSAVDEPMPGDMNLHPKVRVTAEASDRAIYGVYAGLKDSGEIQVWGSGVGVARVVGHVRNGDLLQASALPGVAERQPDDIVRSCTLGKVTRGDGRADERLVPCTLKSG